jgi:hypothetical protein
MVKSIAMSWTKYSKWRASYWIFACQTVLAMFLYAGTSLARSFEWGAMRGGPTVNSIEWTVAQSDLIVIARVITIQKLSSDGTKLPDLLESASEIQPDVRFIVSLEMEHVLKGPTMPRYEAIFQGGQVIQQNESGMYFLRKAEAPKAGVGSRPESPKWTAIPGYSFARLQYNAMLPICDGDGKVIKSAEAAIERVENEMPFGLTAQTPTADVILMSGYGHYGSWLQCVTVPVDDRARKRAIGWAGSVSALDRFNASCILSVAPDAEGIKVLRSLLNDPASVETTKSFIFTRTRYNPARWYYPIYPTRLQAFVGLEKAGVAPGWTILAESSFPATYFGLGRLFACFAAGVLFLVMLYIGGSWKKFGPLRRVFFGLSGICALILIFALIMIYRGKGRIEELAVPLSGHSRLELANLNGSLRVMYLNSTPQLPPAYMSAQVTPDTLEAWEPARQSFPERLPGPSRQGKFWGLVSTGDGAMWSIDGSIARYGYGALSWWVIAVLATILPARRLWLSWRDTRRQKRGCCRNCGYDLRASPSLCPECGGIGNPKMA